MSNRFLSSAPKSSLRQKVLTSAGALVLLSILGSALSLSRMTEVNRMLQGMNHIYVPLGRLLTQVQSDAELYQRESDRGLGFSHWKDPHWRPKQIPHWIHEVLQNEMRRVHELVKDDSLWASSESQFRWQHWANQALERLKNLEVESVQLYDALSARNESLAYELYPKWSASLDEWKKQLQWASSEYERSLRQNFAVTEARVSELRTNLEMILISVVILSLMVLWLGERALRPLAELTTLAREITRRGLRKEDKSLVPEISLSRSDEVSQLAREFHRMATALLEREKTVEHQKNRLQDQNRLLREMGELNQNILNSIESVLIVTNLSGEVTKCNPGALKWLDTTEDQILGTRLEQWLNIQHLILSSGMHQNWLSELGEGTNSIKLGPSEVGGRFLGGYLLPLKQAQNQPHGAILVIDDLTEELNLEQRLRQAENLAAVGRMSAQVAHEVRNPLHSIGLEAEMAAEVAQRLGHDHLSRSLHSILTSVDRLQKITENYLKLSRLSDGQRSRVNLRDLLKTVIQTYAPVAEALGVHVEIEEQKGSAVEVDVDRDLFEQVLGNLLRNSLQALEEMALLGEQRRPEVRWTIGNTETGNLWLRVEDNGPGISQEVQSRLFTPFFTTRAQGTGLGLSFIKKVLEDHAGQICYLERESQPGACFEMRIPLSGTTDLQGLEEVSLYV